MKIPSMFYGRTASVKSRVTEKLKGVLENAAFDDIDWGPLVDTREVTDLLLVAPEPIQLPGEHFHCYAATLVVIEFGTPAQMLTILDAWMRWSLAEPWRFLGVMDQYSTTALVRNRSLLKPYVDAAVVFWPILKAEGQRYGPHLDEPKRVWSVADNLKYALANLGVKVDQLQTEPPGGPAAFLDGLRADRE